MHLGSEKYHGICFLAFAIVNRRWFFLLCIVLFQGYINSGSPHAAVILLDEMLRLGLEPDRLTYNTLINACIKGGDLDAAMKFLKEMKVTRVYLKRPVFILQVLLRVVLGLCLAHVKYDVLFSKTFQEKAEEYYEDCLHPDVITYTTLVKVSKQSVDRLDI